MGKSFKKEARNNAVPRYSNNRELFPPLILNGLGEEKQKEGEGEKAKEGTGEGKSKRRGEGWRKPPEKNSVSTKGSDIKGVREPNTSKSIPIL